VVFAEGGAVVGDLLKGGYLGGLLDAAKPQLHYFVDDGRQLQDSFTFILSLDPKRLLVGHGGPLEAGKARKWWMEAVPG
jgi:hypothetical protein